MLATSPRSLDPVSRRTLLPSGILSLLLHAALLFAAALSLRGCSGTGDRGEADTEWRSVGLVTRPNDSDAVDATADSAAESSPRPDLPVMPDLPSTVPETEAPPVPLANLSPSQSQLPDVLGPGQAQPQFAPSAASTNDLHGPTISPPPAPGLKRGETSFFDIKASGQRFVYVLDASGSMEADNALAVAKAELMGSLQALRGDQQFQIVFYNEQPHVMVLAGKGKPELYWASDINRTLARQFIAGISAQLGTQHVPALKSALALKPDVLYFLTDAEEPVLTAANLNEVRRSNIAGTRIHCIEFGRGAKLNHDSTLERLAEGNGGAYQYRNTSRFGQ